MTAQTSEHNRGRLPGRWVARAYAWCGTTDSSAASLDGLALPALDGDPAPQREAADLHPRCTGQTLAGVEVVECAHHADTTQIDVDLRRYQDGLSTHDRVPVDLDLG